jgi:hypothetical protein
MNKGFDHLVALIRHQHAQRMREFESDLIKLRVTFGDKITESARRAALGAEANESRGRGFPRYDFLPAKGRKTSAPR